MDDQSAAPEKGQSKFEKVADKNASLAGEIIGFLGKNKKWWLLPPLVLFLVLGVVMLFGGTAAAPFIYTFF
jgi:hypothetical protein